MYVNRRNKSSLILPPGRYDRQSDLQITEKRTSLINEPSTKKNQTNVINLLKILLIVIFLMAYLIALGPLKN